RALGFSRPNELSHRRWWRVDLAAHLEHGPIHRVGDHPCPRPTGCERSSDRRRDRAVVLEECRIVSGFEFYPRAVGPSHDGAERNDYAHVGGLAADPADAHAATRRAAVVSVTIISLVAAAALVARLGVARVAVRVGVG